MEGPAAGEAQASSSSQCPGGATDAGSPARDVLFNAGGPGPMVVRSEASAMEGTSSDAVVAEPMQTVAVAEHESKRQRTVPGC